MPNKKAIAAKENVYYGNTYWNDLPLVAKEINQRITGSPSTTWYDHFFKTHKGPFKKILILNCGNGWLERELYGQGYISGEVVGIDYSKDLLKTARSEAKSLSGLSYYQMDTNAAKFPGENYDLIINLASAHHIAYINRVFCSLLKIISKDGLFLNYDYVGPHRNQYPVKQWLAVWELNEKLPKKIRQDMRYPHLPTMLATDPSEAIHSELILETTKRYFDIDFIKPSGGALAYLLITHNQTMFKASKKSAHESLRLIMKEDKKYLSLFPDESMFAYWVAKPKKAVLKRKSALAAYQKEENFRERSAAKNGGQYYDLQPIQRLYLELSDLRIAKEHKELTIHELQQTLSSQQKIIDDLNKRFRLIYGSPVWKLAAVAARAYKAGLGKARSPADNRSSTRSKK